MELRVYLVDGAGIGRWTPICNQKFGPFRRRVRDMIIFFISVTIPTGNAESSQGSELKHSAE